MHRSDMPHLTIDFVSDVTCPWCAVGLSSLNMALQRLAPDISASLTFRPFELNPDMWPGGQDLSEHLTQKYGSTPEQQAGIRNMLCERGAEVGFEFSRQGRGRVYNTFNAHRLLHWAQVEHPQRQAALKMALLTACHRDRAAMDDPDVLVGAAEAAGLSGAMARSVLDGDDHAQAVRAQQAFYRDAGIQSVPAVIVNERYLLSGAQSVEAYERALRDIAARA